MAAIATPRHKSSRSGGFHPDDPESSGAKKLSMFFVFEFGSYLCSRVAMTICAHGAGVVSSLAPQEASVPRRVSGRGIDTFLFLGDSGAILEVRSLLGGGLLLVVGVG